jgi:hypothetical protein
VPQWEVATRMEGGLKHRHDTIFGAQGNCWDLSVLIVNLRPMCPTFSRVGGWPCAGR